MYELVPVHEHVRWQKILDLFKISDIYYTSLYFLSAIKLDPGEPLLFYYVDDEGEVAYPFIKRVINSEDTAYFDITTPFGYGGPLLEIKGDAAKLIENFRKTFTDFCDEEKIIAEFIRFHPLNKNAPFFEKYLNLYPMYDTYSISLMQPIPASEEYKNSSHRNLHVNSNNQVIIKKLGTVRHMFEFLVLYYSTARRREEADSYYFFTDDYFETLISSLGPNLHLFGAFYEEKLVSACYVLAQGDMIFHHLEGSMAGQENGTAKKNLLLKIAEWGAENHFSSFHLGGDFPEDNENSNRLKLEISNMEPAAFYIGQQVHDPSAYNKLVSVNETDLIKRYRFG
ncbi:GNAT family N-acetyltransferase [Planococcus shixiaomingii]|uniref:GNAT family N-acetyltransferase n=1 Tax=Planococcus shixiaomingii TaxID=3058393 RepID=UPI00262E842D|nr:GNAT family N-acetyltransferase [Planococcus sp. N022]WKA53785.1 GNAT family N-acetyltransferase [Planococcus sp. N022]